MSLFRRQTAPDPSHLDALPQLAALQGDQGSHKGTSGHAGRLLCDRNPLRRRIRDRDRARRRPAPLREAGAAELAGRRAVFGGRLPDRGGGHAGGLQRVPRRRTGTAGADARAPAGLGRRRDGGCQRFCGSAVGGKRRARTKHTKLLGPVKRRGGRGRFIPPPPGPVRNHGRNPSHPGTSPTQPHHGDRPAPGRSSRAAGGGGRAPAAARTGSRSGCMAAGRNRTENPVQITAEYDFCRSFGDPPQPGRPGRRTSPFRDAEPAEVAPRSAGRNRGTASGNRPLERPRICRDPSRRSGSGIRHLWRSARRVARFLCDPIRGQIVNFGVGPFGERGSPWARRSR